MGNVDTCNGFSTRNSFARMKIRSSSFREIAGSPWSAVIIPAGKNADLMSLLPALAPVGDGFGPNWSRSSDLWIA